MKYTVWDRVKQEFVENIIVAQDGSLIFNINGYDRGCLLSADNDGRYNINWVADRDDCIENELGEEVLV